MKAAPFDYLLPRNVEEAVEALAASDGAKLIAGGQSLGPMLNLRFARPNLLVDISRLPELRRIEETPTLWRIGAGATHADLEDIGPLNGAELIGEVAAGIAYRSVRNRGTIGGSLAHADPAGDWPLALATLDAVINIRGRKGRTRRVPAGAFIEAAFVTVLQQDEIIESIEVAKRAPATRRGYFKFCRKTGEFPESSAAIIIDPVPERSRIVVGALSGAPRSLLQLAQDVSREGMAAATDEAVTKAIAAAAPDLGRIDLRMHAAGVRHVIRKAFQQ